MTQADIKPEAPQDSTPDENPALAGVSPEFAAESDYDLSDLPEFLSFAGTLPSARFSVKKQLADVQKLAPKSLTEGGTPSDEEALAHMDEIEQMFIKIEELILSRAQDRDAMTKWLCEQEDGEQALMAAFGRLAEQLGNLSPCMSR